MQTYSNFENVPKTKTNVIYQYSQKLPQSDIGSYMVLKNPQINF